MKLAKTNVPKEAIETGKESEIDQNEPIEIGR